MCLREQGRAVGFNLHLTDKYNTFESESRRKAFSIFF